MTQERKSGLARIRWPEGGDLLNEVVVEWFDNETKDKMNNRLSHSTIRTSLLTAFGLLLLPMVGWGQTPIACGQTVTGTISAPGQTNLYVFSGNAGEMVELLPVPISGSLCPAADLYDSGGNKIGGVGCEPYETRIPLSATGNYIIHVYDGGTNPSTKTGDYNLTLQFSTGRCGAPIACGQTITNTLGTVGEIDAYTFNGNAGDVVAMQVNGISSNLCAAVSLSDPSGNRIGTTSGSCNGTLSNLVLTNAGTYTVQVFAWQVLQANIGEYSLTVSCIATNHNSLVGHWTFDEGSGTTAHDSSGNGYDGTLSAQGASFVTGGVSGNALSVTQASNGFVDMGNVLAFTTNSFTTVAWIKTAPGYTTSNGGLVLSKHISAVYAGYFLDVNVTGGMGSTGKALFYFADGSPHWVTSTTTVTDGGWHQIVGVHDVSGTSRIYVDGTPAQDSTASSVVVSNDAHFMIGGLTVGSDPTGWFTGLIDDVQVYDRALSDSEIQFLFENPGMAIGQQALCVAPPAGLVAWWPGDGNANDIISGNNGTLTNGAAFAAGEVGQAFSFSTNHAGVLVGNPTNLQLQDFTIEAWIQRGSTAFATDDPTAVDGAALLFGYGSQGYALGMEGQLYPNGSLILTKVDVDAVSAGPAITDTNLHHVAVAKSGTSVVFYIDGSAYPVAAPYTDTFQFTSPAAIGVRSDRLNGNNNDSFFGTIDEVSIYNRALSSNEVAAIYAAGSAGKCFTNCTATITTAALPSGGGTTSGGGTVACVSSVTVRATPNACYQFVNWTEGGTVVSTSTNYTFTASANRALVANFSQISYTISTSSSPSGGGTTGGGGTKTCGSSVTVSATPNAGYNFVNWTEGGTVVSTSASYTFTASGNRALAANFVSALLPTAITGPASGVSSNAATLNGTVNPNRLAATAWFEWGTTTSYGNVTAAQSVGSGDTNVAVAATLSGLSPNLTYHYRLVASNSAGTVYGADQSFGLCGTSWFDNFESYTAGVFPDPPWVNSGNTEAYVDTNRSVSGSQSLKLFGVLGGCWGALAHRQLPGGSSWVIEFQVANGSEPLSGCHTIYGGAALNTGPSWTTSARNLIAFDVDNTSGSNIIRGAWTNSPDDPSDGPNLGTFVSDIWYKVWIMYENLGDGTVRLRYWINDDFKGGYDYPAWPYENDLAYVTLMVGEGSAWFDNVSVQPAACTVVIGVATSPAGAGSASGGGTYSTGATVTVSATPNSGYSFVNWTENGSPVSSSPSYSFTANSNRNLVANFAVASVAPVASFTASPTNGAAPLSVSFADTSTGTVTNRAWDFGDGGSSASASVIHSYNSAGVYSVSLSVFGPGGADTLSLANLITVTNVGPCVTITLPPIATNRLGFIDGVTVVKRGQTVGFSVGTSTAGGSSPNFLWDFGDGLTSTARSPSHVFTNCGPYDVSVTVGCGLSSLSTGLTVAVTCPMNITSLKLQAKFKRVGSDTCAIKGSLTDLPAGFSVANAAITLDVGDAPVAFQLNAKGRGVNRNGNVKFSYNRKTGVWSFTGQLKGDLKGSWAKYGIASGIVINSDVTVPVLLMFQSNTLETFDTELPLSYNNKSGTSGIGTYRPVK